MKDMNDKKEKKDFFGKIKKSFSGRKFRNGAYASMVSAVVIVIILVANMLISKMNIQFDLSAQNMYTLSGDTKKIVKNLKDDITIYYLVQSGNETDLFKNILKQYDAASDKVKVVNKDTVLYPNFAKKYTSETVSDNSMLVVDKTNGKAKYVDNADLLIQSTNYQTYQTETTGIDVEGQLTSAIQYVTSSKLPTMYYTKGHGETATGDSFSSLMDKMNIKTKELDTLSESSIPKSCDILLINAPTKDFTDAETKMIKKYLISGGKAIITLNYAADDLKNFNSILEYYGVKLVKGIVIEGDSSKHTSQYVNYLLPTIESHDITSQAGDNSVPVFMPDSSGLKISDTKRSTLKIDPLLTTSDSAFSKVDVNSSTAEKEKGDISGPFYLGLVATDTYNNVTSNLVVYSSAYTFSEETSSYSNPDLLSGTVSYLSGDKNTLSIPTKSLENAQIYPSEKQVIIMTLTVVAVIPLAILIIGGVICYKRRKK